MLEATDHRNARALEQVLGNRLAALAEEGHVEPVGVLPALLTRALHAGAGHREMEHRVARLRVAQLGVPTEVTVEMDDGQGHRVFASLAASPAGGSYHASRRPSLGSA